MLRRAAARAAVPGYCLALSLLICAPLLGAGYLLLRDAVSTPRSWLTDAALGLSESAARAVPQDFAVALASGFLDGGVLVTVLLVAGLWLAGWGAARLVATVAGAVMSGAAAGGQLLAATLAVWNPYVAERLLQGHWSLLLGYGCLPWVALTVLRLRGGAGGRDWFALAFWIALAGLTPTGLLLAAVVGGVCLLAPGGRRWPGAAALLGLSVAAALPWLVASAGGSLGAYRASGAPGFDAFAARAEPGLGTLGSLAGLAGIWNSDAVPPSRVGWFATVATIVLVALVLTGLRAAWRRPAARPLLVLAAVAVLAPALAATGVGRALLQAGAESFGGLGVLRDGQKWVALAMPGYALAVAEVPGVLAARWPRLRPAAVSAVGVALLIATLPDLVFGVGGRVHAVHYPPGFAAVAARINADPAPVAVLPADGMRRFGWAGPAPVLDPLPRWVAAEVLSTGDLTIAGQTIAGEGDRARAVQRLLLDGADAAQLSRAGVGWLVLEAGSAGELGASARTLAPLTPVYADDELRLYRLAEGPGPAPSPRRPALIAAHLSWLAVLLVGGAGAVAAGLRRRRRDADRR
ncbi:hypothetical protein [Mycolicibacterium fallax]|jgi:hypothetical protein|uniref:hypothetical protein n=1 Tax=Mycolicibacterium fallax TaxID=1793 RepID=UPI000D6C0DC2|nr:hypothetical protein [Mycolicibacterium fallax]BBY98998.1 hypothetical protein MFAL_24650 [Mycolicibacterium fallax]